VAVPVEGSLAGWLRGFAEKNPDGTPRWTLQVEPTGPILADPDSPRQVVLNLVQNALDATPPGKSVVVRWQKAGTQVAQLSVIDGGPGIPRNLRRQIFEPFYTTKATGSGLGLYAVQTLVERDKGSIAVDNNPGGGARFIVRWPLASVAP